MSGYKNVWLQKFCRQKFRRQRRCYKDAAHPPPPSPLIGAFNSLHHWLSLGDIRGFNYPGYEAALAQTNTPSLRERREKLTLHLGLSKLWSPHHRGLLPPTPVAVHGSKTRPAQRLQPVQWRANQRKKSFNPYILKSIIIQMNVNANG